MQFRAIHGVNCIHMIIAKRSERQCDSVHVFLKRRQTRAKRLQITPARIQPRWTTLTFRVKYKRAPEHRIQRATNICFKSLPNANSNLHCGFHYTKSGKYTNARQRTAKRSISGKSVRLACQSHTTWLARWVDWFEHIKQLTKIHSIFRKR